MSSLCLACALIATSTGASAEMPLGLSFRGQAAPLILDYEVPGHPNTVGRSHVGTNLRVALALSVTDAELELGALFRLPFALDFHEQLGALPVFGLTLYAAERKLSLRIGSLDVRHGHHPAIMDEARYAYARNLEENYNRTLPLGSQRNFGQDLRLGAEHGLQLRGRFEPLFSEVYLDWQLLETAAHREKFAFGALLGADTRYLRAGLETRLLHYGGELFTAGDPARRSGADAVRQPISGAATLLLRPLHAPFRIELPLAYLTGRLIQAPGEAPRSHSGIEAGLELGLGPFLLGYRYWHPLERPAALLSEDGDPVYAGRRAHRVRFGMNDRFGPVEVRSRFDLVQAEGSNKLWYLWVTELVYRFETRLFGRPN